MAHPHHHALSSVKKWGGEVSDYIGLHEFFDLSKAHLADFRHRALRHHSLGIFQLEEAFGKTITLSSGRVIPTRWVGEQHVTEDLGFIPTWADWCRAIHPERWMTRSRKLSLELDPASTDKRIIAEFVPQAWVNDVAIAIDPQGPTTYDVTREILAMGEEAALALRDDTDPTDKLRDAETCPKWIKDWTGPFIIHVEQAIADYFAGSNDTATAPAGGDVVILRARAALEAHATLQLKPLNESEHAIAGVITDLLHLARSESGDDATCTRILDMARKLYRAEHPASASRDAA